MDATPEEKVRLLNRTRHAFGWQGLRQFGQSKVLRSSYFWLFFVPIVARLVGTVPQEIIVPLWGKPLHLHLTLPFSWKVFYYSAICFSIASLTYSLKCPALIKNYSLLDEFKAEGRTAIQVIWFYRKHLFAQGFSKEEVDEVVTRFAWKHSGLPESLSSSHLPDLKESSFPDLFHAARDRMDLHAAVWRWVCAFSYLAGFALISVVVIQNLWFVIKVS